MANLLPLNDLHAGLGATFAEDAGWSAPEHYSDADAEYRAAAEGAALFDLSHHGHVELAGPDARTFLHNLCTSDVKNLAPGAGCETFFTTAKAKVIAHGWVGHYATADGSVLRVDLTPGQSGRLFKHLDRYLISEQVELADRTGEVAMLRLCGPQACSIAAGVFGPSFADVPLLSNVPVVFAGGSGHLRPHALLALPCVDVLWPAGTLAPVWQALQNAGARPAGRYAHETLRVEAGLPQFGPDVDEERFVVEVGRAAQAISYTKGCYLGQEPIVMARDRGQVNRMLLGVRTSSPVPLPMDAKLFSGETEVGVVKSSARSPRLGATIALAYLRRGHQQPGTELSVGQQGGAVVRVSALPFT